MEGRDRANERIHTGRIHTRDESNPAPFVGTGAKHSLLSGGLLVYVGSRLLSWRPNLSGLGVLKDESNKYRVDNIHLEPG